MYTTTHREMKTITIQNNPILTLQIHPSRKTYYFYYNTPQAHQPR